MEITYKKIAMYIGIGFVALIGFLMFKPFKIVDPGNRGVMVTLGSVSERALSEGIHYKTPLISSIYEVSIKQETKAGAAPTFTSDLQTAVVGFNVLYRIPEGRVVELYQQYSGDVYQTLVEPRAQEAIKQTLANYGAETAVKSREEIKEKSLERLRHQLDGLVVINDLVINNIDLSDELEKAIEQKMVREQEALAKRFELDKAKKDAEITIVNAKAEAEAVKIKGESLKESPRVIELEIVKKWNGVSPQSVVTSQGGANVLMPLK